MTGMWLRQRFFDWLMPSALVLPLWLLVGWLVFDGGGWALLWVLFLAVPAVLVGQLVLALLVRARARVRSERAVSWWDVLGFAVWHALVVSLGFFQASWWALAMVAAVLVAISLFWLELWQLWRGAQTVRTLLRTSGGAGYLPPDPAPASGPRGADHPIVVIGESDARPH